ncbi:glycosyltransferase [Bacillus sp. JCM 19041]|uniref:glycosyltransferase n=1 Tax=Bacillus sp. JCM 19041 TaxID=1460637 RepID=UPI0006D0A19A
MVEFYQGLDCFICSSESEHIPLPVLEAAACGIPIISTCVGIVPELIMHNENGLIVPRNVRSFKSGVKSLIDSPEKRSGFSEKIRKTIIDHWTLETCKTDWETFFYRYGKSERTPKSSMLEHVERSLIQSKYIHSP